jgi:uncharacterized protein (DUF1778 family)
LNVTSERQIEANRRNAGNSTGPRSAAGKRRARGNALRHGLSLKITPSAAQAKQIDRLARLIAGKSNSEFVLQQARVAAKAAFDLVRVHKIETAWTDRVLALGDVEAPGLMGSKTQHNRHLAKTTRWTLRQLNRLMRYEHRAAARRDRAIMKIIRANKVK